MYKSEWELWLVAAEGNEKISSVSNAVSFVKCLQSLDETHTHTHTCVRLRLPEIFLKPIRSSVTVFAVCMLPCVYVSLNMPPAVCITGLKSVCDRFLWVYSSDAIQCIHCRSHYVFPSHVIYTWRIQPQNYFWKMQNENVAIFHWTRTTKTWTQYSFLPLANYTYT